MARRTREIWQNLVRQYERSGKRQEEFAAERGIPIGTLRSWIYRLKRESAEDATAILPVRVLPSTSPAEARPSGENERGVVEVMVVRFASGASSELIAEVVARLRRC
jgi:hypothetical protein